MCGIVYSKSFNGNSVVPTIEQRYKAQKHRGSNGFGFYIPKSNRLTHNVKEGRILSLLRHQKKETEVLFHHRFPTSTANVRTGCHPYSTKDYFENNYVVVHNGVLRNESTLKKEHEELGIKYVSLQESGRYNDSEALAFDVARYLEGEKSTISATGSIAFVAIKRDSAGKPMTLFFARNSGNPLKMKKTRFSLTLSSEGEGENIEANTLYSMSYDTLEITKRPCVIGVGYSNYGGYTRDYRDYTSHGGTTAPSVTVYEDEDDEELRRLAATWDGDEEEDEEDDPDARWKHDSEVNEVKVNLLYEANYDTTSAIGLGEDNLKILRDRQQVIDDLMQDIEAEVEITEDDINEYCGNEDKIRFLEEAVKLLRKKQVSDVIEGKEDTGRTPVGFRTHTPPAAPVANPLLTGTTYPVQTRATTTPRFTGVEGHSHPYKGDSK